jgi:hypothetical protein
MKKIFTLVFASLFTVVAMAADRRPSVTVQSSKSYEIVIDGKSYFSSFGSMSIPYLSQGSHTVKVYATSMGRGSFFKKNKRMLDASSFVLRNNDITINVDMFGNIQVNESRGWDRNDNNWGKNDRDDKGRNDQGRNDQGRDRQHRNF